MSSAGGTLSRSFFWPASGFTRFLDFAASAHQRAVYLLILVSLIAFLPGFAQIPPVDRDEPRYAQATKQMLDTGDYVDIRFQDQQLNDKPVGIYWLQATAVKIGAALGVPDARKAMWVYRIPSLIGALGSVLATYWCALCFVSRRAAMLAALMMAASILLGVEARLAKTDAMLLLTVVFAMGALARVYLRSRESKAAPPSLGLLVIFWTAIAVGVLIKGLAILMVAGLTAVTLSVLDRSARWLLRLRPILGIAWTALLVLPWLVAISMRIGDAFLLDSVGHDTLGKILNSQQGHGGPPGFYLVLFFLTFFPASMLAGLAAPAIVSEARRQPAIRFLLAWLVPSWIVFELAVTKLPHYVLPLYPAIAILLATAVEGNMLSRRVWLVRCLAWWFLAPLFLSVVVVGGAIAIAGEWVFAAWPFLAASIACGLLAWKLYRDNTEQALMSAVASSVLLSIGIWGLTIPALGLLFPSPALARVLQQSGCAHPAAAAAGYEEPSLVFLAGTSTKLVDAAGAADFLQQGPCRFAFIEMHDEPGFAAHAQAIGLQYDRRTEVEAFNLGRVERISIGVFQSKDER
ncbi:MAG TPA: glycosyltransferase family 39 protein [Xanthobacteraceae bacterium]|nr:glycosyltransferase family 39 protein [Xanthobacteraceae bacterium]